MVAATWAEARRRQDRALPAPAREPRVHIVPLSDTAQSISSGAALGGQPVRVHHQRLGADQRLVKGQGLPWTRPSLT
jgi:hypothetical protein